MEREREKERAGEENPKNYKFSREAFGNFGCYNAVLLMAILRYSAFESHETINVGKMS